MYSTAQLIKKLLMHFLNDYTKWAVFFFCIRNYFEGVIGLFGIVIDFVKQKQIFNKNISECGK